MLLMFVWRRLLSAAAAAAADDDDDDDAKPSCWRQCSFSWTFQPDSAF